MRQRARRAARTARGSLVVLGVAVAWLALVGSLTTWTMAPVLAGWRPYVVMTDSMRPSVAAGDVVLVSGTGDVPLRERDVLLVADDARPDGTRLHRFLRVDDEGRVVTKGDANASEDSPSPASDVLGRTRIVVPVIGLPAMWVHRGQVPAALAAVVGTVLAVLAVRWPQPTPPGSGADAPGRVRAARRPARGRHARAPRRRLRPVPAGAVSVLVVTALVAQPAAPGFAVFQGTASNGPWSLAVGAWKGYDWTLANDPAPLARWRLNDNAATTTAAAAVGAVNGTYFRASSATFQTGAGVNMAVPPAAATRDGAQRMLLSTKGGSNQRQDVTFGDVHDFAGTTPFSVEVWFRQTASCATCYQRVVSKEYYTSDTNRSGWSVHIFPTQYEADGVTENVVSRTVVFARVRNGVFDWAPSLDVRVALNTWYHVVGVYDGSRLDIYVNGEHRAGMASTASLQDITDPLRAGAMVAGDSDHFVGDVDELSLYGQALTPRQVKARYLAGSPAG